MKIDRFEDMVVWQKTRLLVKETYQIFYYLKDNTFKPQLLRAAVSIINNIAEGFERKTNHEFKHFLFIAKGSCAEVRSMLYLALDLHYIDFVQHGRLKTKSEEVSKMLSGLIKTL